MAYMVSSATKCIKIQFHFFSSTAQSRQNYSYSAQSPVGNVGLDSEKPGSGMQEWACEDPENGEFFDKQWVGLHHILQCVVYTPNRAEG